MEEEIYVCLTSTLSDSRLIGPIVNSDYKGLKKLISAIAEESETVEAQSSPFSHKSSKTSESRPADDPETLRPEPGSSQVARTPNSPHRSLGGTAGSTPRHAHYGSSDRTPPLSGRTKIPPSVKKQLTLDPLEDFVLPPPARSYPDAVTFPVFYSAFSLILSC